MQPVFSQAFAQYTPDDIWDLSTMAKSMFSMTFPNSPDPGEAYLTPNEVSLQGLTLANPSGAWPATGTDPAITWVDNDNDKQPGVTWLVRNTGNSSSCNFPYANLPIPSDGVRMQAAYVGTRTTAYLDGTIGDCNTVTGATAVHRTVCPNKTGTCKAA